MSCDAVIDFLTRETGRFDGEIYNRHFATSPWIGLTRKEGFPEGLGETISNLTYERSAPTDAEPTWSAVAVVDGAEGGACLPAANKISVGSTTRNFTLYRRVLEGPDICAEELRTPFQVAKQLDSVLSIISEYARLEWEIRYKHEYRKLAGRKVIVGPTLVEGTSTTFPTTTPGGILTWGVLNRYRGKLLRDGAVQSALGMENGNPILTLITDWETSDRLIFENSDIRNDLRYGRPSELLAAYGVERSYRGFYVLNDPYPERYSSSAGTHTELAPFSNAAATKGIKSSVNSSWEAGAYTVSHIFDPTVFTARIPRPITSSGGNTRFNAVNYTVGAGGSWALKNIPDRVCNPDGNIVFHRGHLAEGSEPVHPERGVSFLHTRCDPALNMVTSCT